MVLAGYEKKISAIDYYKKIKPILGEIFVELDNIYKQVEKRKDDHHGVSTNDTMELNNRRFEEFYIHHIHRSINLLDLECSFNYYNTTNLINNWPMNMMNVKFLETSVVELQTYHLLKKRDDHLYTSHTSHYQVIKKSILTKPFAEPE